MGVRSPYGTLLCVSDSQGTGGGRTAEGAEVFRWYGSPAYNKESWETEGAGEGPSVTVATGNQHNILMNRDFEITGGNTTTGQFPNWVVDAGTPGTHTVIESSVTTSSATSNVYRGLKALRFDSTGTPPASIQVSQVVPVSRLKARTCYHFGIWYKASAAVVPGDLTIQFEGTGYSAGGTEKISVAAASLATTWTYKEFWVNMPDQIPADGTFKLVIKWTGTPTASKQIWFDAISFLRCSEMARRPETSQGTVGAHTVPLTANSERIGRLAVTFSEFPVYPLTWVGSK